MSNNKVVDELVTEFNLGSKVTVNGKVDIELVKSEVLADLLNWFNWEEKVNEDGKFTQWCTQDDSYGMQVFDTLDELLKSWIPTLEGADEDCSDEDKTWQETIAFINSL